MRWFPVIPLLFTACVAAAPSSSFDAGEDSGNAGRDSGGSGGDSGTGGSGATGGDAAVDSGLDGAVDSGSDADVDSGADATIPLPCGVACGGSTPYCDTTSMTCVACLSTAQCPGSSNTICPFDEPYCH